MRAAAVAVATLAVLAPAAAIAQGRVVVEGGLPGPQMDANQSLLVVKRPDDGSGSGGTMTLAVQPHFTAAQPGASFAVLLATPAPPIYGTGDPTLFDELAAITATRIEEHIVEVEDPNLGSRCVVQGCAGGGQQHDNGCGGSYDWNAPGVPDATLGDGAVEVIPVGPYEVLRLTAADTTELAAWLDQFGYLYTQADLDAVAPYLARGDTITAVRVVVQDPGTTALDVLTMTWSGDELRLPLALGRPPAGQSARLAVYISADGRHDVGLRTPEFAGRRVGWTYEFLTRTEVDVAADATIDTDPPVTRSATDTEIIPVETVDVIVRVPVTDCEREEDGSAGCCDSAGRRVRWDAILVAAAILSSLRRRRSIRPAGGRG